MKNFKIHYNFQTDDFVFNISSSCKNCHVFERNERYENLIYYYFIPWYTLDMLILYNIFKVSGKYDKINFIFKAFTKEDKLNVFFNETHVIRNISNNDKYVLAPILVLGSNKIYRGRETIKVFKSELK